MNPNELLNKTWQRSGARLLIIGIMGGLLFAGIRGIGIFGPAGYRFALPAGFILMISMPFIFLNKEGRRRVGFVKSNSPKYYLVAVVTGIVMAMLCYGMGLFLFGLSTDNWFVSIKNYYYESMNTAGMSLPKLFIIFTVPALLFSPIGEEIFFRGFLQEALTTKFSYQRSMVIDSLFFALIHLFHHGIVKDKTGMIQFYPLSGLIWVLLMFITAMALALLKKKSGSIYPAILAHVLFNLIMNACIFYGM